jgi:hypothetical protein
MFREWFVGEVLVGASWLHDTPELPREVGYFVGVGFELSFASGDATRGRRP